MNLFGFAGRAAGLLFALGLGSAPLSASAQEERSGPSEDIAGVYQSEELSFQLELVAGGLETAWGLDFLPDGRALVTDRSAERFMILDTDTGELTDIANAPDVNYNSDGADGGFLDVLVHPGFADNGLIYYSFGVVEHDRTVLVIERAHLVGNALEDRQRLFTSWPAIPSVMHMGARLVLQNGYLFASVGDRYIRDLAQLPITDNGSIIRLYEDGRVPDDNPFVGRDDARPEIWSYGHRNPQGMTLNPFTGDLWEAEHGPRGGDEINIIRPGRNYGWPIITYGEEYAGGPVKGGITEHEGMEQPVYYYVPSIAPSGLTFYTGDAFPAWKGNLFIGGMAIPHLGRLVVEDDKIVHEERLLADKGWRFRVEKQGPDGNIYVGVDTIGIIRLKPAM